MAKYQDVIIAGFGGQGVMLIGNLLAQAGMEHGLEVSFIPVYGAEMRGGTANCTVVLDEHPVGSPLVNTPRSIIVLNEPSLAKFQPRLHPDGVQIVNASLISEGLLDGKHRTVYIPVNDIAHELGKNVLLVNDLPVIGGGMELHNYDRITIGTTQLVFVGLCGEQFGWEEEAR